VCVCDTKGSVCYPNNCISDEKHLFY
jgi:hypothetical protein